MILQFNGAEHDWVQSWAVDVLDTVPDHKKWLIDGREPDFNYAIKDLEHIGYRAWIEPGVRVPKLMVEIPDKEATFLIIKYS
jgi:hypothetical protein